LLLPGALRAQSDSTWRDHNRAAEAAIAQGDWTGARRQLVEVDRLLGGHPAVALALARNALRLGGQVIQLVLKEIDQDLILGFEVIVQGGLAQSGSLGDLAHGGLVEALLQKYRDDLVKDLVAAPGLFFFGEGNAFGHAGLQEKDMSKSDQRSLLV